MPISDFALASLLSRVRRPGRYAGGERGACRKDWDAVGAAPGGLRACLLFPDLYELGMGYLGTAILYHLINRREHWLAERCYAPADDMYALLHGQSSDASRVRLWSLESRHALSEFDALLVSFTYEMSYPQFLRMLDAGGVPLLACERGGGDPIVLAGGGCAANPEPLADFIDAWGIGDGEALVPPMLSSLAATKGAPRTERLRALAAIPGVYVPSLYDVQYDADGYQRIAPRDPAAPAVVHRAIAANLNDCPIPLAFPIANIETVSERAVVEIMRGCPEGCRFCQAGFTYRPARYRAAAQIRDAAVWLTASTGYDEVALQSLSSLSHPDIAGIFAELRAALDPLRVSVGLPSLRMDALSRELALAARGGRETSLTFAIEAGAQRIRDAINKRVSDDDIFATLDAAMSAGWHKFKLYFMCGFAGETMEDIDETAALIRRIARFGRGRATGGAPGNAARRLDLHVSLSVLIPKPETPLAWQPMERIEITESKQARIRLALRDLKNVRLNWHDAQMSSLEALFSRGDRRIARVLLAAHERGFIPPTLAEGKYDAVPWFSLCRDESIYQNATDILDSGLSGRAPPLDPEKIVFTEWPEDTPFPWSHIDYGVSALWLARERKRVVTGAPTTPCDEKCEYCGLACE